MVVADSQATKLNHYNLQHDILKNFRVNVVITNNSTGVTAADYALNPTYPAYSKNGADFVVKIRTVNYLFLQPPIFRQTIA